MKKTINFSFIIAVVVMLFGAFQAKADDCSKVVDKICNLNKQTVALIDKCSSLDELDQLANSDMFDDEDLNKLLETCSSYVFTADDKERLKKSFYDLNEKTADKMVDLLNGMFSKEDVMAQLVPVISIYNDIIDASSTLGEFIDNMGELSF